MNPSPARGFLFDLNRCTGCNACELACSTENELGWGRSWRHVATFNEVRRTGVPTYHLSLACNHCEAAPCIEQCPALAIRRDTATGAVLIEADRCIGCRYCSWVCPYDAPRFDDAARIMGKCTLCDHRLAEERQPACVEGCPTAALRFGPLEGETQVPGFPETEAAPAIRFEPLRQGMKPPESTWSVPEEVIASFAAARPDPRQRISLASEWPLLVFSTLVPVLSGWILATVAGGGRPSMPLFLAMAALAAGAGAAHLGRKARAWRALLNVGRSWLSREVAAFGGFVALSLLYLRPAPAALESGILPSGTGAAALGLACLFCMDRVYDPVRTGPRAHSADTLLTGLLVASLLTPWLPGAFLLGGMKLFLYVRRLFHAASTADPGSSLPTRHLVGALRLGLGLGLPALLWMIRPDLWPGWAFLGVAAGEIIDRVQFYLELEVPTPRANLAARSAAWRPVPIPGAAT